jgi:acyl-[acyl-carrier-protein]-phospholipid O-acyltransferase/long-chain-fatty-acid--[acyl-carrier-protein] ligase
VVLHTLPDAKLAPVLEKLAQCDLPPLWKPRANQFFQIEALPYLGTGKIDLRGLKARAADLASKTATV